jgi:hypothetical protein
LSIPWILVAQASVQSPKRKDHSELTMLKSVLPLHVQTSKRTF